MLLQFEYFPSV